MGQDSGGAPAGRVSRGGTRFRAAARSARLAAAYLATFELPTLALALTGRAATRDTALGVFSDHGARLFDVGFRRAGMALDLPDGLPRPDPDRPVVVLLRHAGTLNSHLMFHLVTRVLGRRPVCPGRLRALTDPAVGLLVRPTEARQFYWNEAGRKRALQYVAGSAATLGPAQALAIFPEGTNITARRRARALAELRTRGMRERAEWAAGLRHVLPPQHAGVVTALRKAAEADVLVVGHQGLEDLVGWAYATCCPPRVPSRVRVHWWHTPAADVPRTPARIADWIDAQWQRMDAWLDAPAPALSSTTSASTSCSSS
ncbi:hypothetical protein AB0G79_10340 [Streptomyces sp. NPDC020807]|uniref:hypothetical protein n=1 Tax=Streptomyces sp. NPDC020807 TaxID=3155119 RepID=UPI0033CE9F45